MRGGVTDYTAAGRMVMLDSELSAFCCCCCETLPCFTTLGVPGEASVCAAAAFHHAERGDGCRSIISGSYKAFCRQLYQVSTTALYRERKNAFAVPGSYTSPVVTFEAVPC